MGGLLLWEKILPCRLQPSEQPWTHIIIAGWPMPTRQVPEYQLHRDTPASNRPMRLGTSKNGFETRKNEFFLGNPVGVERDRGQWVAHERLRIGTSYI